MLEARKPESQKARKPESWKARRLEYTSEGEITQSLNSSSDAPLNTNNFQFAMIVGIQHN